MYACVNKTLSRENDDANGRKKESRIQDQAHRELNETFLLEMPNFSVSTKKCSHFPTSSNPNEIHITKLMHTRSSAVPTS